MTCQNDEMQKGLLAWYDFEADVRILCVGENTHLLQLLSEKEFQITCATIRETANVQFIEEHKAYFDYVIVVGMLEKCYEPVKMLERWKSMLQPEGKLLLGVDNRLGLRYFCGDRDPFTNRNFDGVENYRSYNRKGIKALGGRCYARNEIEEMLDQSGFCKRKFYSVMPNLNAPMLIYGEDFLPNEELAIRYTPLYNFPDSVFLQEELLYSSLIRNGLFHVMANSYLIECSDCGSFQDVSHVTLSMDRGRENTFATIIKENRSVEKRPLYKEGSRRLERLAENSRDLMEHGVPVVEMEVRNGAGFMPYISAPTADAYMQELLLQDKEKFVEEMDRLRELILQSSEHVEENELGVILKRGYIDLVPLNCFHVNDGFLFFDQEFCEENYPANVIIYRTVGIIYRGSPMRGEILPSEFFWKRYGMEEKLQVWQALSEEFTTKLRNKKERAAFNDEYLRNSSVMWQNRIRANQAIYRRELLESCFDDIEDKKIYVFGSGKYADKFLAFYRNDYEVCGVVDNDEAKWGQEFCGYRIEPPDILGKLNADEYKVIICISRFESVYKQLRRMEVKNIGLFDANYIYPGRQKSLPYRAETGQSAPKKYHIGYIAGVFDLFHIGHLNMFRRAKEQCDYLIAGVVSDAGVRRNKQREPFIPFEERIEMVRACRYVDEAVEIPFLYGGTVDAHRKYHFDCQFSGSDYIDAPWWLEQKRYLEEHGAEMVFFPYTQQTSSTKIKALIEKGLL